MKGQYVKDLQELGFSEQDAETAFDTFIRRIQAECALGDGYARVPDLGSFRRVRVNARQFNDPKRPETVVVKPAHYTVRFRLSQNFKNALPSV